MSLPERVFVYGKPVDMRKSSRKWTFYPSVDRARGGPVERRPLHLCKSPTELPKGLGLVSSFSTARQEEQENLGFGRWRI